MKHNKLWLVIIPILLVVLLLAIPTLFVLDRMGFFTPDPTAQVTMTAPEGTPELVFVADYDFDPYSYLNEDGSPNGLDVELSYELANRLGMRPRIEFGTWSECKKKIKGGDADVLLGLEIFVDGAGTGTLKSIPVGTDTLSIIGYDAINDAAALSGKKVGVSFGSALMGLFKLNCEYVEYFTYSEMLEALNKKEIDYAICHASVAIRIIEKNKYSFKPSLVLMESFPTMGLRKDRPELQKSINHALEEMSADGTISTLRDKWIVTNIQNRTVGNVLHNYEDLFIVYVILAVVILSGYIVAVVMYRSTMRTRRDQLRTDMLHDIIHSGKWSLLVDANDVIIKSNASVEANTILNNDIVDDGHAWLDVIHPDDREYVEDAFKATIRDHSCQTHYDVIFRMADRNGEYHWFHSAGRIIRNADGTGEFFGIHIDVSDQVNREQAVAQQIKDLNDKLLDSSIKNSMSQMQPHFLYNALASIREVVLDDPEYASDLIYDFTTHLRACIKSMDFKEPVPFEQELTNIKAYVNIEKMRFGERLNIVYDLGITDFKVVALGIQPLVENAIKHGICKKSSRGGTVTIRTFEEEKYIVVQVIDDGVGFDYDQIKAEVASGKRDSTGMKNFELRFQKMMHAKVDVDSKVGVGTTITIKLPK